MEIPKEINSVKEQWGKTAGEKKRRGDNRIGNGAGVEGGQGQCM
jgi:hypothetical protein